MIIPGKSKVLPIGTKKKGVKERKTNVFLKNPLKFTQIAPALLT
jgi:hypothetical protein